MKEQKGATLIEALGVIGILGVVSMGIWTMIGNAYNKMRLSQGVVQLQTLQKGITRFYAAAGNYNGLADDNAVKTLIENNIPPPNMLAGTNKLRHSYGGEVVVKNVPYTDISEYGSSSDSFAITFKGLTRLPCVEMASISWLGDDSAHIISITIGTNKYTWPSYDGENTVNPLPITRDKAMLECLNAPKDIKWEFR